MATDAQVEAVRAELAGRKGFDGLLDEIEPDIVEELCGEIADAVLSAGGDQ